jgi:short-subunit dehydrogenase
MRSFEARRVFISGGSSGIGKEIAREFLKLGAQVTIAANVSDKLTTARTELSVVSPSVSAVVCDIADLDQVRHTAATYVDTFGPPDILVNNAGYAIYRAFEEMEVSEIDRLLRVNFIGACLLTREFLPAMIRGGGGHVVIMASIAGRLPMTPCGVYSAAKHGLVAWAETLRAEVHRHNIHVHAICPGRVETPFFHHETFVQRAPRREAQSQVSVESVAHATIQAVQSGRFLAYRPRWHRLLVWVAHSLPVLSRPALQYLMRARVASLHAAPTPAGPER